MSNWSAPFDIHVKIKETLLIRDLKPALKDDFQSELRSLRTLMFINIINGALDGMRIDVIR